MIDIGKIEQIESICKEELRLENERRAIKSDAEYSIERLKVVYAITRARASEGNFDRSKMRECFLFVSMYVFDPTSIVKKMRRGLRSDLAVMLGVRENNVSKITKHLLFHYRLYKDFRNDVDAIHDEVLKTLKKIG